MHTNLCVLWQARGKPAATLRMRHPERRGLHIFGSSVKEKECGSRRCASAQSPRSRAQALGLLPRLDCVLGPGKQSPRSRLRDSPRASASARPGHAESPMQPEAQTARGHPRLCTDLILPGVAPEAEGRAPDKETERRGLNMAAGATALAPPTGPAHFGTRPPSVPPTYRPLFWSPRFHGPAPTALPHCPRPLHQLFFCLQHQVGGSSSCLALGSVCQRSAG